MSQNTPYLQAKFGDLLLRGGSFSAPATVYVGLATAVNSDRSSITEVTGGGYARQSVTFGAPISSVYRNSSDAIFPQATTDWGSITHVVLYDAVAGGNALDASPLSIPVTLNNGMIYQLLTGQIAVTF